MNSGVIVAALSFGLTTAAASQWASHTQLVGKLWRSGHQCARHRSDRVTQTNNLRQNHRRAFAVSPGRSTACRRTDHSRFGHAQYDADRG